METADLSEVLKYLSKFEAGEFSSARTYYLENGRESPEVEQFLKTLVKAGFQVPFDWTSWTKEAKQYFDNPDLL